MSSVNIAIPRTIRDIVLDETADAGERTRSGRLAAILESAEGRKVGRGTSYQVELKADLMKELDKVVAAAKANPEVELTSGEREAIRMLRIKISQLQEA